uniref:Par-3 family cell polarity regulator beta n=1 Tax=Catharus ustulatus TaxID=91951 RepID=A0A8C3TWW8_CATUS
MKVTVCFGRTGIVVPCKDGQLRVRDLTQQALQRYRKAQEKDPASWVNIHHLEYTDGGILDPDDVLADVVEDKDKLIAVYDEQEPPRKTDGTNGNLTDRNSPDSFETEVATQLAAFQPIGEIEVTPSALKLGTPLLVRRSSDPALGAPADFPSASHPSDSGVKHVVAVGSVLICSIISYTIEINIHFYRSRRDGLFHENECIVKINHVDLTDKTFAQAQDIFRQAMKFQSVILEVLPPYNREQYEKSAIAPLCMLNNEEGVAKTKIPPPLHPKPALKTISISGPSLESGVQGTLQQAKSPNLPRLGRKPSSPSLSPLMGFGNKRNAKKIKIDLKKGPEGLGFTVVTRDSSVHGPGPIFVKNILPKGAAVKDGRLQSGDRILEVNGRDITGRTQEELVAMLRSTKQGETVCLIVARQEEAFLPRELDGRLRVNDQLVAVNGESLLGKSNHEAMETLRRSMSMEGNIRGRIQLVVLRRLELHTEGVFQKSAFDGSHNFAAASRRNDTILQQFVTCSPQEGIKGSLYISFSVLRQRVLLFFSPYSPIINSAVHLTDQHINFRSLTPAKQSESINLKASKSMDLVADESKVGLLAGHKSDSSGKDFGPTLGLKKSSSLESLQTAVAEVRKNELPFHRPRPHVVRGRGCNESFRAAIDKSYDGPEDGEEDGGSDKSSHCGQEAQNVESASPGNPEIEDAEIKQKKDKKSREKDKKKGKSKIKEKKKKEENEDPEKKKKKGFGVMLRFGKKKEDKSGKADQKGTPKQGMLKEEELEKMKDERERIGAKHQELRQKQLRGLSDYSTGPGGPDIDDDEVDPNYARVNHFREAYPPAGVYRPSSPAVGETFVYLRDSSSAPMEREHLEGLYAKINKQHYPQTSGDSGCTGGGNADRIQRLRKEYHQARREGLPFYEDDEARTQLSDYNQCWVPGKGPDGSSYSLHFEGVERQYASLPRRGPAEPLEYLTGPRVTYKERDLPYYHGGQPVIHPSKGNYIRAPDTRAAELRYPPYYPAQPIPNQHKGPLRQDVPPSPPQSHRAPAYSEIVRHRGTSPDHYQYRQQDPRQKNPMTAAV